MRTWKRGEGAEGAGVTQHIGHQVTCKAITMKTTTELCRFGSQCFFLPLCLFYHSQEVENDQGRALAFNQKQKKRKQSEFPATNPSKQARQNSSSSGTLSKKTTGLFGNFSQGGGGGGGGRIFLISKKLNLPSCFLVC